MTRSHLVNCELFDGERVQQDCAVIIAGDVVEDIVPVADVPADADAIVDLGGALLAPGLLDLQVNGGGSSTCRSMAAVVCCSMTSRASKACGRSWRHIGRSGQPPVYRR